MSDSASARVTVANRLGMHARPAMAFVDAASAHACKVTVQRVEPPGGDPVDGKSIMQVMMLAATKGAVLEIVAEGEDAEGALAQLVRLIESGFGEE